MTHRCSEARVNPEDFKSRSMMAIERTPDGRPLFEGNLPVAPPTLNQLEEKRRRRFPFAEHRGAKTWKVRL